jgi:uncharacterized secreted protein with C-terminal beta-propeller domain
MKIKTYLCGILILTMIISGTFLSQAQDETTATQGAAASDGVYLYTGSPLVLADGKVKMLDSTNPDLGATVIQSRTLLPLRAVSEYFGADVTYNQAEKEAVIKYGGKTCTFPIGSGTYTVDDGQKVKEYTMDSKSILMDGRTMVPLRVICENVLGKKVSYYDRVIAVADREMDLKTNAALVSSVRGKIGEAVKAGSMKELGNAIASTDKRYYAPALEDTGTTNSVTTTEAMPSNVSKAENASASDSSQSGTSSSDGSYSTTNVQVEGIDEADIVKTDGKYLYIAGNSVVRIVGADKGTLSDATAIRLASNKTVSEIYVDGGKLVLLGTRWETVDNGDSPVYPTAIDKSLSIMPPYFQQKSYSFVDVYDISNPLKPTLLKEHEMEGSYQSSRKNGDIVYMVTSNYPSGGIVLPLMKDSVAGSEAFSMKLSDVMIMPYHPCPGYLIISAVNVSNMEKTEVEAITAYGATMYMNDSALYLAFSNYSADTTIIKFELAGMKVGYAGSGDVPGYLLNQFSMDEYEGNLRVATTVWETSSNSLYILDSSMNITGSIENLAKGETIYSVRFMGSKGYVVTYRTMDPLFVFDLSDPTKPILTGELEVPGFSNYLQPVGENLLLGIGADTYNIYRKDSNGKDIVIGTRQGGIKFSLFDVSDVGKPKEISKYVIGDSGSSTEAFYNHKAIMVDKTNENIGIDAYVYSENSSGESKQGAVIMSYKNEELALKGFLTSEGSGVYGYDIPYARRLAYIGDVLYYIQDGRITSYNYDNLKEIDTLILQ